ncbi:transglutaminase-like domain-containing protein [[Pseudopropionibacterium] massiliense]|uniref:transglutaminase-like domain-containing protein n=1 Tax=[Pseudopropionibacterium] massiliense TaxID=2220000 RepID=UPI0013EF20A6|nr:transglutaminase-like domain-containing protein [[Pseudopropionibacterium] massiliense]
MRSENVFSLPRVVGAWLLLLPGVVAFQPVFGGISGYLPALVGITAGALIPLLAARFRWSAALWLAAILAAYLLLGGPFALPETMINGFVPSLTTIARLMQLTYQGWYDILTVATPAGDLSGPQAAPLLGGILFSAALVGIVRFTRTVVWPMPLTTAWLALGIAFGIRQTPTVLWLGAALGAGLLVWATAHRISRTGAANAEFLVRQPRGLSRRTWQGLSAMMVITLAAGAALGVNALTSTGAHRQVLRDHVVPPLNLQEYPSPLTRYRLYELNQKDDVLFQVSGMPAGGRLRLAVMDEWNGVVFNVSQNAGEYLRVGRELPWQPEVATQASEITAQVYDDVWVPSFGEPARIEFEGEQSGRQARGLHFNRNTKQALTTARIGDGSMLRVTDVVLLPLSDSQREGLRGARGGAAPLARVDRVPEVLVKNATEWTQGAASHYEELSMIEQKLRTEGFYSDGSDNRSRAGHTAERLAYMFNQEQWVGDDEQYAAAMALMATQLGIPVRVVMGFYPAGDAEVGHGWQVRGTEAHVWVEAFLEGAGWVNFDPTPDRNRLPSSENPQPKPKPKPRVDPPPTPPERAEDETVVVDQQEVEFDDPREQAPDWVQVVIMIAIGAGGILLVLSPLIVIALIKGRRAFTRRRRGEIADQVAGAWDEVVDRARDLGFAVATNHTRRESADSLQENYPSLSIRSMADQVDASVFGPEEPGADVRESVWERSGELKSSLLATKPWYARPAAFFSLRSLRRVKVETEQRSRKPQPHDGGGRNEGSSREPTT